MCMSNVFVVPCNSYRQEEVDSAVEKALVGIRLKDIVSNKRILLEPNVLFGAPPEKCITTHPAVLEAVIKILKRYNTKIIVGDTPFSDEVISAFRTAGLLAVCKRQGVELVNLSSGKYYKFSGSRVLSGIKMTKYLDEVDMVINVPKAKCHRQMYFTGAMKGVFSLVSGYRKGFLHLKSGTDDNLGEAILDIFNFVKPRLSIFDAVYGLEGNGPGSNGKPKFAGFISASRDSISLDYVTVKLLGLNPNKTALLRSAKRRGQLNERDIKVRGDIHKINVNFKEPDMISVDVMPKFITRVRRRLSNIGDIKIE